ncbi:MAG: SoxR reducing system RseC family protein [Desulfuromonadaceae bacterium]|nr:SoxR reducing system RseC family protein [Desulfuromonadaceae bacterium]
MSPILSVVEKYRQQLLHPQKLIREVGTVVELKPNRLAVVACSSGAGCSSCAASGGCCQGGGDGQRRLLVDNVPCARIGDQVRVEVETRAELFDSTNLLYLVSFIMLALGLAVGYGIATLLPVGVPAALLALLIGAAFMAGTLGVFRFGRQAVVQISLARIVEIVAVADVPDAQSVVENNNHYVADKTKELWSGLRHGD